MKNRKKKKECRGLMVNPFNEGQLIGRGYSHETGETNLGQVEGCMYPTVGLWSLLPRGDKVS